uniref:Sterigmatocystin biosynthesis regulatory protein n=1 Tax=Talaromyces marneffei PM1 TaxID=1077442 RepID=A0A093UQJ1_TALMA
MRYIACVNCSRSKARCDKKVPCMRCISKQLVCEPRAARRSGNSRSQDQNYRTLQPQRQVELEGDSQTPDDMTRNTSGVRPFSAGPQAAAESHPPSTTSAAELFQASSGVYSPHFQLQQWTLDTLSSQTTLPQDWLAEISRQIEIEQITDSLPTSEWESYLHQTPTTIMGNWRNPPMLDANMTGLAGNATDEPYRRGSFEDDMALNSGESQGDRESVTIQDSPQRLFPTNFRPKSIQCFSQARFNIERLEHILKTQNQWFGGYFDSPQPGRKKARASAEPISNTTRDQLLVVTQLLLQQSRTIHNRNAASSGSANINPLNEALISLPPTRYFRLCPGPSFTPNEIFKQLPKHGKIAGILLLLMIAVGAAATPSIESHDFAIGVAEICRLAFSEILERDFSITVEPLISQCALLLLYLGMWAGERWLMGISSAQREMYIHSLSRCW